MPIDCGALDIVGDAIIWEGEGEVLRLEPYGRDALRLRASKSLKIYDLDWNLLPPLPAKVEITRTETACTIRNGKIIGEVRNDGTVVYYDENRKCILEEYWIDYREMTVYQRRAREYHAVSSEAYQLEQYFKPDSAEHFFGMGQYANDCLDLKGCTLELAQKNSQISIPFLLSTKGYGLLWNNPSIGEAALVKNHTKFTARSAKQIDYLVIASKQPEDISCRLAEITGKTPLLPEFAAGFWQCKLRYKSQEELLNVAREYKRRKLPISVIVIDYFHWTNQGEWKFEPTAWPDPKGMVAELKEMGIRVMVSIWPTVDFSSENYDEMRRKNYLLRAEDGISVFYLYKGTCTYFDATHPGARKYVWDKAKQNYYDYGIDMFWLDEAEPEINPYCWENVRYYLGNGLEVTNIYPSMYAKAFYDGQKEQGQEDIVNLTRCGWIGSQRFSTVLWSGDIPSTFDSLRRQIKAGLNISLCGISWWTTDIGGFYGGDPTDPDFRELIIRWFQFGVFCPIFRLHGAREPYQETWGSREEGSGADNELWSFGEDNYPILARILNLREKLRPYIMKQMETAHKTGTPVMRPLYYDFPEDSVVIAIEDEYMFGSDILVAPVAQKGMRKREVYLPQGTKWRDANTGKVYAGGSTIICETPLDVMLVFVREMSSLPIEKWFQSKD